jgi:hypothetical protein
MSDDQSLLSRRNALKCMAGPLYLLPATGCRRRVRTWPAQGTGGSIGVDAWSYQRVHRETFSRTGFKRQHAGLSPFTGVPAHLRPVITWVAVGLGVAGVLVDRAALRRPVVAPARDTENSRSSNP